MTEGRPPHRARRVRPWVLAAAVLASVASLLSVGWALGAPGTVGPGSAEQGQGADVGEQTPTYWVWEAAQVWNVPSPVPGGLAATPTAPTVLPAASTAYRLGPATAGNISVRWTFDETTAAPRSTELELRFVDGLSRAPVPLTVYLETQATAPGGALLFHLFWDAGAYSPSGVNVQTMQVDVLVCTSVGHCP